MLFLRTGHHQCAFSCEQAADDTWPLSTMARCPLWAGGWQCNGTFLNLDQRQVSIWPGTGLTLLYAVSYYVKMMSFRVFGKILIITLSLPGNWSFGICNPLVRLSSRLPAGQNWPPWDEQHTGGQVYMGTQSTGQFTLLILTVWYQQCCDSWHGRHRNVTLNVIGGEGDNVSRSCHPLNNTRIRPQS